jgi:hypothetical protein
MQERAVAQTWTILLLAVAVLFNPFIPIHLNQIERFGSTLI